MAVGRVGRNHKLGGDVLVAATSATRPAIRSSRFVSAGPAAVRWPRSNGHGLGTCARSGARP